MAGYITLSLGGYTVIFAVTILLLISIMIGILIYRQIQRLRNNSVRKLVNSTVAVELSKKRQEAILKGIHTVHVFRKAHFPKFTDCIMISEHANATHVYRMIAFDEMVRDIDHQLEFIDPELSRIPGESYYSYLKRIKSATLPELEEDFIARLAFLHEWCRYCTDIPFGVVELEEVRTHLKTFLFILNKSRQLTSTYKLPVFNSFLLAKSKSLESAQTTNLVTNRKMAAIQLQLESLDDTKSTYNKTKKAREQLDTLMERTHENVPRPSPVNITGEEAPQKPLNFRNNISTNSGDRSVLLPSLKDVQNETLNLNNMSKSSSSTKNTGQPVNSTSQQPTNNADNKKMSSGEFGDIMSKVWTNMKKIMGFSPDCKNGGHKNLRGNCMCPKYYSGELCENMLCLNGGALHPVPYSPAVYCKCPYPDFITGKHCEVLRCHNGGRDLGNGSCNCVDGWYSGRFCEYYASSWLIAVCIPLIVIALLVAYCVFCGFGYCPRRETSRRDRHRRMYNATTAGQRPQFAAALRAPTRRPSLMHNCDDMTVREQMLFIHQNLLNERQMLNGPPMQECVVRLEHLPAFNPRMAMVTDPTDERLKKEPPPSYEQAMLSNIQAVLTCPSLNAGVLPPIYSPTRSAELADGREPSGNSVGHSDQPPHG